MDSKVLIFVFSLVLRSNCDTKVWLDSTEIYDQKNWQGEKIQQECNGLVFAETNDAPAFINNLKVSQLVLPRSGTVRFEEGSNVLFEEESKDDMNCVELKPLMRKAWYNVTAWKNLDNPDNPAVPYSERPPGRYDDIVIPKGFNSTIMFIVGDVDVKSVNFGGKKLNEEDIEDIISSDLATDVYPAWLPPSRLNKKPFFKITGETCHDPSGCDKRASVWFWSKDRRNYLRSNKMQCSDAIVPDANWGIPICGATIVIKTLQHGFTLEKINRKLRDYKSYTHAGKYDFYNHNHIQIIFTEKDFTGSSLVEATEFYNLLREDSSYFCEDITLKSSGPPIYENSAHIKNAVSVIFGTLIGVVVVFGLLFLVYSPTVTNLHLRNRIMGGRPLSTYILRYDNMEDRSYIVEGESVSGSIPNLNRSFENPLYDEAPSTRSTSNETIASIKEEKRVIDVHEAKEDNENTDFLDSAKTAKNLEEVRLEKDQASENSDILLKDL